MIFLSHIIDENTPSYGDRDKVIINPKSQIINNLGANTNEIILTNNHIGTHIDTPFHFYNDGKKTEEYLANEFYFKKIHVIEIPCENAELLILNDNILNEIPKNIDFLIIKTGFEKYRSSQKYYEDNPGLHPDNADRLKNKFKNLKAIGFDFISLTSWKFREEGRESHRKFLNKKNEFIIVEDMKLSDINQDTIFDFLILAPLRIINGNGGPTTIIAKTK